MKKIISLNLIVVVIISVFYAVTVNNSYNNIKGAVESEYITDATEFESDMYTAAYDEVSDEFRKWSCAEEFLIACYRTTSIPHRVIIYDSKGNEIARTSTILQFDSGTWRYDNVSRFMSYYCNLDDYLIDEQKQFMIESNENHIKSFACIVEDEKNPIVKPVYILYNDMAGNDTYKLNFSDEEPNAVIDAYNVDIYFVDDRSNKSYEYIDKQIEDKVPQSYFDENDTDIGEEGLLYFTRCNEIYIGSERCSAIAVSYIDSDDVTLHNYRFTDNFRNITILYLAVTVVILAVLNFYIKRSRQNKAKYVFTNAAAHELKTPLAVIENKCEFILEGVDESKTTEYVNETYKEALRMNTLLNNLLCYNKLSTINRIEKSDNNLAQIIKNELEKYSSAAEAKNISFNTELTDTTVKCNGELISLAVGNLLSNAVKFSPSGSTIAVKLVKHKKRFKVSVTNQFDGELDKKVWDMLYVNDEARSGKTSGMGLPISKEIFDLHNYKHGLKCENGYVEFYFIAK